MKIVSYNVNGIRAAMNKGFVDWLKQTDPDIIGLQEVKALENQIDTNIFKDLGYQVYWYPSIKKGYSGVAALSKIKPKYVEYGMGMNTYDDEGRMIRLDFDDFSFASTYFPSGTTGDIRQTFKYRFLDDIYEYTQDMILKLPKLVISGDYNICHRPIDIHNPVSNKNSSGFLPEERAWMEKFIQSGFIDSFRSINQQPHHYTWWSYRAGARKKNMGWRIDYHMVGDALKDNIQDASIMQDIYHSDHCPISLDLDFKKII
jgi:exodeoxyribonuclease-3